MFDERKALDVACYFMKLHKLPINYMKLLKYMYIYERNQILEHSSVTISDDYFSMKNGPVLSKTYDLIKEITGESAKTSSIWHDYIIKSILDKFSLELTEEKNAFPRLSKMDMLEIEKIFHQYKSNDQWEMSEISHTFPEWTQIQFGREQFSFSDIVNKSNKSEDMKQEIIEEIEYYKKFDELFA